MMRWRVELVEEKQVQMQPIQLGPATTPVPDGSDEDDTGALSDPGVLGLN
jgi:hypothetical protein